MSMNWNSPVHPEFLTTDNRRLSVNRIFCIAKNYEEHAKEMGGEIDRKAPFHFQKSFDALTFGPEVRYPVTQMTCTTKLSLLQSWVKEGPI